MSRYVGLFVAEYPSEDNPSIIPPGWAWVKPSTGQLYVMNEDGEWVETDITFAQIVVGNLQVTGDLYAGSNKGLTGSKVFVGKRLTFTKGILTGFEDE